MPSQTHKVQLLDSAGYNYNFDRMMFINRRVKKAFSSEFVEDKPEEEIAKGIDEPTDGADWRFYTSIPLTPGLEREIKRLLQ
jgi:hypothetical protein